MSKQTFRLPTWRRKPTADETAPDRKLKALLADERCAAYLHDLYRACRL